MAESLNGLFTQLGIQPKIKEQQVVASWQDIVGEQIANLTSADRVIDQVLYVKVKNMTWRTELLFHKSHILENIEKLVGKNIIKDIRFL